MSVEAIIIQAGQGKALSWRGTQVAYKAEGQRAPRRFYWDTWLAR